MALKNHCAPEAVGRCKRCLALKTMLFPLRMYRSNSPAERWPCCTAGVRTGKVSDWDMLMLDPHSRGQSDVLGACERIKNTPLPLSYRSLLRHGLVLYYLYPILPLVGVR